MESSKLTKWLCAGIFVSALVSALFAAYIPNALGIYDSRRVLLILIVSIVPVYYCATASPRDDWMKTFSCLWPVVLLAAVFAATGIFIRTSIYNFIEPVFFSAFLLSVVLLGDRLAKESLVDYALKTFLFIFVMGFALYALVSLLIYGFYITGAPVRFEDILPWGFVHIRYWSHLATWLLPILPLGLLWGDFRKSKLWRLAVWLSAAVWWWLLLASMGRGSIMGILISTFAVLIFWRSLGFLWLKYMLGFMVCGALAWLLFSYALPSVVFDMQGWKGVYIHSSGRRAIWGEALAMSSQNFPFGMGPQSWMTHAPMTDSFPNLYFLNHPHNMYLLWAAEYGWICILAVIFLSARMLRLLSCERSRVIEGNDSLQYPLICFSAAALAAVIHAGVSAVFIAPASMLVGFLVLTIFWSLLHCSDKQKLTSLKGRTKIARIFYGGLSLALVAGFGWYWGQVMNYYRDMKMDYEIKVLSDEGIRPSPRFWFHGYFPRSEERQ